MDSVKACGCNCQNKANMNCRPDCHGQKTPCAYQSAMGDNCMVKYDEFHDMPLAMAYVPWQTWRNVYDGCAGLNKGSIFGELILPFEFASPACRDNGWGGGCNCGCNTGRRWDQR